MEEIKTAVKAICILTVSICMTEYLTSWTRLKNQMKYILNGIFILIFTVLVINTVSSVQLPSLEDYAEIQSTYDSNELYISEIKAQTEANITLVLQQQLDSYGIKYENIETTVNISETNSISISKVTVTAEDFKSAERIIKNSLGEETEVINGDNKDIQRAEQG
ncbi:MAG: hypothetical protein IKM49_03580 [Ruminococcus sp.]|nr:hypothetical protein [Ruminococcus sp.]